MTASTLITTYLGSGLFSNRPATPSLPSGGLAFYYATDTSTLYKYPAGGAWSAVGGGSGGLTEYWPDGAYSAPPVASTWTQLNFASSTSIVDFSNPVTGVRLQEAVNNIGNTNTVHAAITPIPGTNWTVTARIRKSGMFARYNSYGLVLYDSASTKLLIFGMSSLANSFAQVCFNSPTSYNTANQFGILTEYYRDFWIQLQYDGTNCYYKVSNDGVYFSQIHEWTSTALWGFLTNPATHLGFGYNANTADNPYQQNDISILSWVSSSP